MERLLLAIVVVVVASAIAQVVKRRRSADAPTQAGFELPVQIDRSDFESPEAPWFVAVFSSDSCSTCADVVRKAEVLRSSDVAVQVASYQNQRQLHERYAIDAVPCLVIADSNGVVQAGFLGQMTATDLWAALAELRSPGSIDAACDRHAPT
jgi:hypothetical protein